MRKGESYKMKKPYKIKIGNPEDFYLDEILKKVKERSKEEEILSEYKKSKNGGKHNGTD